MNYNINTEGGFLAHFKWLCPCALMLNPQRSVCTLHTKICDLIHNYIYHGKNQPCQEVEDGYIFVNIFVKNMTIRPIIFMVHY